MSASPTLPPLPSSRKQLERQIRLTTAECLQASFRLFTERFWAVAEPATPFIGNWHVDAVCEHLEAVARGQIRKLLINIPPGHAKSLLAAVLWPAWVWTWRPEWRGLFGSYGKALAVRDSVKCRSVVESQQYRELFCTDPRNDAKLWGLREDQNAKDFFENTRSGFRLSLGVGGEGTGYRGNCVLADDPLNATDAPSKAARDAAIFWWDQQMSSRVNDLSKDSFVIIQQRLHEDDLAGHVLSQKGYEHLCLPSEFSKARVSRTVLGTADRRTEEGELLFPKLFPKEVLDEAKKVLGPEGYSGQHDQLPSPPGGGLLKREYWRFFRYDDHQPATRERPRGCSLIPTRTLQHQDKVFDWQAISVDCSFKSLEEAKGRDPDYVVIYVIAGKGPDRYLLYRYRKQIGFEETCQEILEARRLFPKAWRVLIEDKANGSAVINVLRKKISGVIDIQPEGGKEARANACEPQIRSGNVFLPEGAPWLEEFVGECAGFPRMKHDDQVDALTQCLIEMHGGGASRTKMLVAG